MNTSVEYFRAYQTTKATIAAKTDEMDTLYHNLRILQSEISELESEATQLAVDGMAKFAEENKQ